MKASTLLSLAFLVFTEYSSQKGIVLLEPGKGPRKMTVDFVIDGSSQTPFMKEVTAV